MVFETDEGEIGDGYHVTEFKAGTCDGDRLRGARLSNWSEATLQLLDGQGVGHMPAGKFAGILKQSIAKVSGLGDAPLQVEFAHGNRGQADLPAGNAGTLCRPDPCRIAGHAGSLQAGARQDGGAWQLCRLLRRQCGERSRLLPVSRTAERVPVRMKQSVQRRDREVITLDPSVAISVHWPLCGDGSGPGSAHEPGRLRPILSSRKSMQTRTSAVRTLDFG